MDSLFSRLSFILEVVVFGTVSFALFRLIYNLYFSPLAKFPGPRIAAATSYFEFYHDYFRNGKYLFEIEKMHDIYGPIVRVNPNELSIRDPAFYNSVYVTESKRRTDNYHAFMEALGLDGSFVLTDDHDLHRRRRKPMEPFFSRKNVASLQPTIVEIVRKLERRLREFADTGRPIRLEHAFFAVSADVVGRLVLSSDHSFLEESDFAASWHGMFQTTFKQLPLITAFPFLLRIGNLIPESAALALLPMGRVLNKWKKNAEADIKNAKMRAGSIANPKESDKESGRFVSLFEQVIAAGEMPASELSDERLVKEAQVFLGAGTNSSSHVLSMATYYLLSNPSSGDRLRAELATPMADWSSRAPTWVELERLPYLQAVLRESLRLSYGGTMHRLPRVSPDVELRYGEHVIPKGVPVGMSAYFMHMDSTVFPDPYKFIPERWLGEYDSTMSRNFVPFTRGSRNCIGMNIAMSEMSLVLAMLFRPGGLKFSLFETDESDVRLVHDFTAPLPKLDSKGVRVLLKS